MSDVSITRNGKATNYDKLIQQADKIASIAQNKSEELSDADVDNLIELLDGNKDPMQDMPSNNGVLINKDGDPSQNVEEVVTGQINAANGLMMTIPYNKMGELTEADVDDIIALKEEDMNKVEMNEENVSEFLSSYEGLSDEDTKQFINAVNRYRRHEKFSYFKELPLPIQKEIDKYVDIGCASHGADKATLNTFRNQMAKELYDSAIFDNYQKKAFHDIAEYTNQEISKEADKLNESMSSFNASHRKKYEHDFLEEADRIEKEEEDTEENREKVAKLRAASHNFIQAYTYEEMYKAYKNGKIKVKPIMVDKFKRTCTEFNQKYYNSNFTIRDIGTTISALDRNLPKHYDIRLLQKFIVAFIVYTRNYKPSDVTQHIFMYFFIQNILTLDVKLPDEESINFNVELTKRICDFIDLIIQRDEEKKAMNNKSK